MKEAYYFSHDSNARHDPKITAMRGVYGSEGYGWYWILVEMMRESDGYKLDMRSKYAYYAFASQMQCGSDTAHKFIQDCITEFDLFAADETHFWSASLLRRMEKKEEKSEKARKAAEARWGKKTAPDKGSSEDVGNDECDLDANAYAYESKNDALKESKVKESKRNKNKLKNNTPKIKFAEFVSLTQDEYDKLVLAHSEDRTKRMIEILDNYKGSKGKKYASDYRAILNWVVKRVEEEEQKGGYRQAQPFGGGQAASSKHDANSQAQASQDSWSFTDSGSNQQDRQEGERRGLPGDSQGSTGAGSKYDMFVRR
ncbi:DUF4373 domain-containing protein [Paenibacillus polymyxa]|uniref:DUF4373 domain-containing protein n=1 Tax=Paenibacillus polymyxa TaxID=1406 RepID=UPI0009083EA7|nr:DUF4373 domain-containing protein [Paenibacillus polymyxa]APB77424.1 DUF4373 domain-containing protein [Paenibacillus polymyxa]